ncbi:MAG TPA: hypothetical protein VGI23_03515, partial [Steroidobacteraceae bacterium]
MTVSAEWRFTLIPLGIPNWIPTADPQSWTVKAPVFLVCLLTVADEYNSNYLRQWILENGAWVSSRLSVAIIDDKGTPRGQTGDLYPAFTPKTMQDQQQRLITYLTPPTVAADATLKRAEGLPRDRRFDALTTAQFFSDSPKFYARTIPRRDALVLHLASTATASLAALTAGPRPAAGGPSMKLLSLLNSYLMEQLISEQTRGIVAENVVSTLLDDASVFSAAAAETFRRDQAVLLDRVLGYPAGDKRLPPLQPVDTVTQEKLKSLTEEANPNHLVAVALKDAFLARELGLVTSWTLQIDGLAHPAPGSELTLGLQLDLTTLHSVARLDVTTQPTMFRMGDEVSPAPRNPSLGATG